METQRRRERKDRNVAASLHAQRRENIVETGVDNLTKDEASMLVHLGKDKTWRWTLVRLEQDDALADGDSLTTPTNRAQNAPAKKQ